MLLKKTDAQLNQAIKRQDFGLCMELKGRMETIRQMSELASNGENVAEEIEDLTKIVNSQSSLKVEFVFSKHAHQTVFVIIWIRCAHMVETTTKIRS